MEILKESTPVARKGHTCDFCNGKISIGEKYKRYTVVDGYLYDFVCHFECEEISNKLNMHDVYWSCGLDSDTFIGIIDDYVCDHHYDKESRSIETDWKLQKHELVKKILEELKNK